VTTGAPATGLLSFDLGCRAEEEPQSPMATDPREGDPREDRAGLAWEVNRSILELRPA